MLIRRITQGPSPCKAYVDLVRVISPTDVSGTVASASTPSRHVYKSGRRSRKETVGGLLSETQHSLPHNFRHSDEKSLIIKLILLPPTRVLARRMIVSDWQDV